MSILRKHHFTWSKSSLVFSKLFECHMPLNNKPRPSVLQAWMHVECCLDNMWRFWRGSGSLWGHICATVSVWTGVTVHQNKMTAAKKFDN